MLKRLVSLLPIFTTIFLTSSGLYRVVQADEAVEVTLSNERYVILGDVNESISLSQYFYMVEGTKVPFSQLTISELPASLTYSNLTLIPTEKGIFPFKVSQNQTTKYNVVLITKLSSETEYLLYEENFDGMPDGSIPTNFTQVRGTFTDQSAYIQNGRLILDARTGGSFPGLTTQVLLPDYLGSFGNYVIESDFTILAATSGSLDANSRWGSVMYRYTSNEEYYQMAIRKNASASNGVEVAQWDKNKNPWTWTVFTTASHTENLDASKMYRVKIDMKDQEVQQFIDGNFVVGYDFLNYLKFGRIGLQATQQAMTAHDNFRITLPVTHLEDISVQYTSIPALYNHPTGIINAGPVAHQIEKQSDIDNLVGEVRPQIGTARIDKLGDELVVMSSTNQPLMSIKEFMRSSDNKFIPAFHPVSLAVALDVANFLKEFSIVDSFIISDNPQMIIDTKTIYPILKGVLIDQFNQDKLTLSDNDLIGIRNRANQAMANVVVIPNRFSTKTNVEYLQRRLVNVWVHLNDANDVEVLNGVLSGANGFYTNDFSKVYAAFDRFPAKTQIRRPFIIGHRGIPSLAPENTRGGFLRAVQEGADIIELDVFLSSDNKIVVIHDSTTTRTAIGGVNYPVESTSYESVLKNVLLKPDANNQYNNEFIPTLDQVFDDIKGTGVVIFVEIKSSREALVPVLKDLIQAKGISDQVVVISFSAATIGRVVNQIPEVSVGNLSASASLNINGAIENGIYATVPNRTTFNSNFGNLSATLIQQLHYRGITTWPWTLNTEENLFRIYSYGVGGITTDFSQYTSEELNRFRLNERQFTIDLNLPFTPINIRGSVKSQTAFEFNNIAPTALTIVAASGTTLTLTGANITSASGTGKAFLMASYETAFKDLNTYQLFDQLIEVDVVNSYVPPSTSEPTSSDATPSIPGSSSGPSSENPSPEEPNASSWFVITFIIIGGGGLGVGGWFLYKRFISK
jgi:glycerophosphoryl diester phosphodiesterase